MKQSNMINAISSKRQQIVQRWAWTTSLLLISLFVLFCIVESPRLAFLRSIKQESALLRARIKQFDEFVEKKRALKEREQILQDRSAKIERILYAKKQPTDILQTIIRLLGNEAILDSFTQEKKLITCIVSAASTRTVFDLVAHMKETTLFKSVNVQMIQQQKSSNYPFVATLKATL